MKAFRTGRRPRVGLYALSALVAVTGCSSDAEGEEKQAAPALPAPAVVVAELRAETVPIFRQFVARTEAVDTVQIQARVEALLAAREFEEGAPVKKGQVLYRLDPRTYNANLAAAKASLAQAEADLKLAEEQVSVRAAEAALVSAEATLKKAQQDVARLRPLAEKDAVPRQDLDTAIAAEEVAQAQVDVQEAALQNAKITEEVGIMLAKAQLASAEASVDLAELDLEYCTITSPMDGLIGRTEINIGNLVGRGEATVLAMLSSIDPMYVTFSISEEEYLQSEARREERGVPQGQVPMELILADDSVYEHIGAFVTAERAVAVETGTLQLVVRFPNPPTPSSPGGHLRPGQFGRIRVQADLVENAVLVPQRAIMEQQGAQVVFVVGEGDIVALRTIQTTERHEEYFVVASGLEAGERVIVEGQLKARPGSKVKPMDKPVSSEPGQGE